MSEKPQPVTWCTECGAGLAKDNYCIDCLNQTIADQQRVIDELKKFLSESVNLLNAVGHIGVDFGHGPYSLCRDEIEAAQRLYAEARKLLGDSDG